MVKKQTTCVDCGKVLKPEVQAFPTKTKLCKECLHYDDSEHAGYHWHDEVAAQYDDDPNPYHGTYSEE